MFSIEVVEWGGMVGVVTISRMKPTNQSIMNGITPDIWKLNFFEILEKKLKNVPNKIPPISARMKTFAGDLITMVIV